VTGAKLARASLPARVWIEWRPIPKRPWRVLAKHGSVMSSDTAGGCERWLARYGYVALIDPEREAGPVYVRQPDNG
jgi:hypothetical protein